MSALAAALVYVASLLALGAAFCWRPGTPAARTVGRACLAGLGGGGYLMLLARLSGLPTPRWAIFAAGGLGGLALLWRWRRSPSAVALPAPVGQESLLGRAGELTSAAVIVGSLATVALLALAHPLGEWDAFAIWSLKARVIFEAGLTPRPPYFGCLPQAFTHLDYPLLLPALTAGAYAAQGGPLETGARLPQVVAYLGLLALLYDACRRQVDRFLALALVAAFGSAPALVRWAGTGYADLLLGLFICGAACALLEWQRTCAPRAALACGACAALMALTKSEGLPLAAVVLALLGCVAAARRERRACAQAALAAAVWLTMLIPWWIWSAGIPRVDEDYLGRLLDGTFWRQLDRLSQIGEAMLASARRRDRWGLAWLALALAAAVGWRRFARLEVLLLSGLLLAQLGLYAAAFVASPWQLSEHIAVALERLLLQTLPTACLLAAALLTTPAPSPGCESTPSPRPA